MNPGLIGALAGAVASLAIAVITAVTKFSTNRATATKITSESEKSDADTAEVFSRLAAEWTVRADKRVEKLEQRIERLVHALETLTEAVEQVTPVLELSVKHEKPELAENVFMLRKAARDARRLAL